MALDRTLKDGAFKDAVIKDGVLKMGPCRMEFFRMGSSKIQSSRIESSKKAPPRIESSGMGFLECTGCCGHQDDGFLKDGVSKY